MNLFIDNYNFGIKSVFCSEYGLRHWEKAKSAHGLSRLAHRVIGAVECFPVLGHVVSLIEGIMHACFSTPRPLGATPPVVKTDPVSTDSYSSMIPNSTTDLPTVSNDDEEEEFDYEDDGLDPIKNICNKYTEKLLSTNNEPQELWFVSFLGFCLLEQNKIFRDALRQEDVYAYGLLQFVWIQWALAKYQVTNNWDHVPDTSVANNENSISLQKAMEHFVQQCNPTNSFKVYFFSQEEFKKLLSDNGNIIEFFKNKTDLPHHQTYLFIAEKAGISLGEEFSQFTVVKEALTSLFQLN